MIRAWHGWRMLRGRYGSEAAMTESGAPRQVLAAQEHPEAVWAPGVLVLVAVGLVAGWVLRKRWDRAMRWDRRMQW
jgi:hypothetical protein